MCLNSSNNSNLNKAHDPEIQTYKQAATAATTANEPGTGKGRKES